MIDVVRMPAMDILLILMSLDGKLEVKLAGLTAATVSRDGKILSNLRERLWKPARTGWLPSRGKYSSYRVSGSAFGTSRLVTSPLIMGGGDTSTV